MIRLASIIYLLASTVHGAPANATAVPPKNTALQGAESVQQQKLLSENDLTVAATQHQGESVVAKKREIPDALVDHPEDFDESEDNERDERFEMPSRQGGRLDFDATRLLGQEYPIYGGDERRKRMATIPRGRTRISGSAVDQAEIDEILSMMNRGHYFNDMPQSYRSAVGWGDQINSDAVDEDQLSEEAEEFLDPVRDDYWSKLSRSNSQPVVRSLLPNYRGYRQI